jgi:hypothetical protein
MTAMSNGTFEHSKPNITCLTATDPTAIAAGWVHVGTHSVWIALSPVGDLKVEVFARGKEDAQGNLASVYACSHEQDNLSSITITKAQALSLVQEQV